MRQALDRHRTWMLVVTALVITLALATPEPGRHLQLGVLAGAVALLGVPHGALDHRVGRRVLRPLSGRLWWLPFLSLYLGAAGLVMAAWIVAPAAALIAFLALSVVHFGFDDPRARSTGRGAWALLERVACGALPVVVPCLSHPVEVAEIFGWLVAGRVEVTPTAVRSGAALVGLVVLPMATVRCWRLLSSGAWRRRAEGAEILALVSLHWAAPPLVAFVVYFCGWHSFRHLLEWGGELASDGDPFHGLRKVARAAVPLSLATLAGAALAVPLLIATGRPGPEVVAMVVFVGLSALTLPHMAFLAADRLRQVEWNAEE